jgi:ADP-heptose:LPS heptosyltransferase
MLALAQYESINPKVNRFLWCVDRIGALIRKPPSTTLPLPPVQDMRRILLLRCDGIGDLICSIPAIQAICAHYSSAQVDLMVGPWNQPLASMIPGPANVLAHAPWGYRVLRTARKGLWLSEDMRMRRVVRECGYNMVIDLRGDLLSLVPMWLWGIPVRVGRVARGGGFAVTHSVSGNTDRTAHEVERTKHVACRVGAEQAPDFPRLEIPADTKSFAGQMLNSHGLAPDRTIVLCPFAQWEWKCWPMPSYVELCRLLAKKGFKAVVVGGPENLQEAVEFSCATGAVNLAGSLGLHALAGLFSICRSFVGVDSGPAHVAGAAGASGVVLFGSSDPQRFGPCSDKIHLVQRSDCPYYPCYQRGPCQNEANWCMEGITVDDVMPLLRL